MNYEDQTFSKDELKEQGFKDKEIHQCDCVCGLYRNNVPTTDAGTPDKHYIVGHEPNGV